MSGQREAQFLIQDSRKARQLREKRVAERIQALFSVHLALAAARAQGEWVTLRGSYENTEKAKKYILSLCMPETVREWQSSSTSANLLFSENSRLRDDLEKEFQTVILPSSGTPGCIHVQGSQTDVQNTLLKIASLMTPLDQDYPHQYPTPPSPPSPPSSLRTTAPPHPAQPQSTTYQHNYPPTTTAGSFPASPPLAPSRSSTQDREQELRDTLQQVPGYAADRHKQLELEKRDLLKTITTDIERDGCGMVARGLDSAQREQTIQYFVSLNFSREKTEAVINSMGWESDYDDILQRLVNIRSAPPVSHNVTKSPASRPRSSTGEAVLDPGATLRPVVIDGSNVAMRHGNGRVFSCKGIELAVQWFKQRGHQSITVFVPQWRREPPRAEYPITDQDILNQLEVERIVVFTPSRRIGNKKIVCYDDRFIVRLATETGGVIVSNDNFRDLTEENDEWRKTIEQRLVMFTFVNDIFMPAEDPLGRHGPSLNYLLQMEPTRTSAKGSLPADQPGLRVCPYAERCTFGKKCRYYHPEREGRDSALSARSATASPVPERRHTGGSADLQKDLAGQSDQVPSGSGRRSKSPQKSASNPAFPSQPGPDSRIYVHQDPRSYQQEFQGYPPAPQGYLQPPCPPQEGQSFVQKPPHYLGIMPTTNGTMSSQPASLHHSPRHPTPTTPMGTYTPHTFPIANLSLSRPRNRTECIQTDLSPLPPSDFSTMGRGGGEEDARSLVPRAPTSHPVPPSHQQPVDPLPGLVPRGDYSTPYPPVPSVPYNSAASSDVHQYDRTSGYPQRSYHHAYTPTNSYFLASESPPNARLHNSPVRNGPQNGLPPQPPVHGGNGVYSHSNRHSAELNSLPENQLYTASPVYRIHNKSSYHLQSAPRRQSMPTVPDYVSYPYRNAHSVHISSNPSPVYVEVGSRHLPYPARGVVGRDEECGDEYRSSFSAPELNRNDKSSNINWGLFKKAQAVLPDHEQKIMNIMLRYPNVDLENLVHLVQQS